MVPFQHYPKNQLSHKTQVAYRGPTTGLSREENDFDTSHTAYMRCVNKNPLSPTSPLSETYHTNHTNNGNTRTGDDHKALTLTGF